MEIKQSLISKSKWSLKCPYAMTPEFIVIHNTANDATAEGEIAYMKNNSLGTSFHIAVDDKEAIQGIPFDRNAFHAGDGKNGKGNRKGISIEICYSKSGGTKFMLAENNAAVITADLLKKYGWDISRVKKHQDFSGKYCPHRTLDMGWERFLDKVKAHLKETKGADDMTKAEVIAIIKEYEAEKAKETVGSWSKDSFNKATKKGILDGSSPKSSLTREMFAVVLDRLGLLGK
jgi:N-acetylmuramoyl-L-alanine amidase CwlA